MNEYLENLKNTQGKKSPSKSQAKRTYTSPAISNHRMTILNQSPGIEIKKEKLEYKIEQDTEDDDEIEYLTNGDLKNLDNIDKKPLCDSENSSGQSLGEEDETDREEIIVNKINC
jgi:hypothetical protein